MAIIQGTWRSEVFGPVIGHVTNFETTEWEDAIFGGGGIDKICAQGGDDEIEGGDDNDLIDGGTGNDYILGDGPNKLGQPAGNEPGDDSILGNAGDDIIYGNAGDDTIWGEAGDDELWGGAGDDVLVGGSDYRLFAYDYYGKILYEPYTGVWSSSYDRYSYDNDTMNGGAGNDAMYGYIGEDLMKGGAGNDSMDGGYDDDTMSGGAGDDQMTGGDGDDDMKGCGGNDKMDGGYGDDVMDGGNGHDCLIGGEGNDEISGGNGNDTILGDSGYMGNDDSPAIMDVYEGYYDDTLSGGKGDDEIDGGYGKDTIDGGEGNDIIAGGSGADDLTGGTGADAFVFRQNEDYVGTVNVIRDYDSGDKIVLCGQDQSFYFVNKINFVAWEADGLQNDVRIRLSDGTVIVVIDAKADFEKGISENGSNVGALAGNLDDFMWLDIHSKDPAMKALVEKYCHIDCEGPDVGYAPDPINFCKDYYIG